MWTLLLKDTDCCSISFFVNLIPNISAAIFWKQRLIWNWYNFIQLLAKSLHFIPKVLEMLLFISVLLISLKLTCRIQNLMPYGIWCMKHAKESISWTVLNLLERVSPRNKSYLSFIRIMWYSCLHQLLWAWNSSFPKHRLRW